METMPSHLFALISLLITNTLIVHGITDKQKEQFFIGLTRVSADQKMTTSHVIETYIKTDLRKCVLKCVLADGCRSINHHEKRSKCETLDSSSSLTENLLVFKKGWNFYEADPAQKNNGHYCSSHSPCPDTHICVDTYETPKMYNCRCKENFTGRDCDKYIGPGKQESDPAGGCFLLRHRYPTLKNGFYWLKKKGETEAVKRFCELASQRGVPGSDNDTAILSCDWLRQRYPRLPSGMYLKIKQNTSGVEQVECQMEWDAVHGNWGTWNDYDVCSKTCGTGTKTRTRQCDNPPPKYGGKHCSADGSSHEETKICNQNECCRSLNKDYPDGGFTMVPNIKSWGECSKRCRTETENNCRGWTYVPYSAEQECFLKRSLNPKTVPKLWSGLRDCGRVIIQQGDSKTIHCKDDEKIDILESKYGTASCEQDVTTKTKDICGSNKHSCTLEANPGMFGQTSCANGDGNIYIDHGCLPNE